MRKFAVLAPITASLLITPLHANPINPGSACVETAANAEGFKLGRQIIEVIIPADSSDAMMKQLMGAIVSQMRKGMDLDVGDPGALAILDKHLNRLPDFLGPLVANHLPVQKEAAACAYTHEFSVDELRDIAAFASSPAGKHFLSRSTALMSDPAVAEANQAYFAKVQVASQQFEAELSKELMAYFNAKKGKKR